MFFVMFFVMFVGVLSCFLLIFVLQKKFFEIKFFDVHVIYC